ncbi:putative TetR family transcriptional regulator [metagenome]|uniref:Putative TetR family transcriptional regulator n=1 Tax=metagenome TaxID=256318 RepID=A0A2P2BWP2_9ZZZZ
MARNKEPWRRDRILDAALALLAAGRTDQLRIADVAQAAGVSPASVHYHFGDLSSLVLAAMGQASDEMNRSRRDAIAALDDPAAKLRTLIALGIPDVASPALVMMYTAVGLMRVNAGAIQGGREHVKAQVALYQSVIEQGIGSKVFRLDADATSIATTLVAIEDAFDLYLVLGIDPDGARGRSQAYAYAASALSFDLIGALRKGKPSPGRQPGGTEDQQADSRKHA